MAMTTTNNTNDSKHKKTVLFEYYNKLRNHKEFNLYMRKATVITGVIILMLISIWTLGLLGPILVSFILELLAWWIKGRNKQK